MCGYCLGTDQSIDVLNMLVKVGSNSMHPLALSSPPSKGSWILESEKFLLVESGVMGFGIHNPSLTDKEFTIQHL